ncbi:hypothetical protein J7I84_06820 [Arthrobacter sp. ISL-85]|uniref:hypothetical protein n=1 Tax=Arthrobacter sp. ISL-85 TaxID=2819115 RepID=UPI001BE5805B|nr:hypothetical protein [Arthrobacter sp. ISL-85]MBT2566215.1 hypothetical protein [Arthrobacter sp. ISL-85]
MAATLTTARMANTVRTAALSVLVLFTAVCAIAAGLIHQELIADYMAMNVVSGWAFWAMTAGCYASAAVVGGATLLLWRNRAYRKTALVSLAAVGAFMSMMIGLYFYVHAPIFAAGWLPFEIQHEPLEEAGTAAVISEAMTIIGILAIALISSIRPKTVGVYSAPS